MIKTEQQQKKFDEWQDRKNFLQLQIEFATERVKTHLHLLNTQSEPGNLPIAVSKWRKLLAHAIKELADHIERGKRWQHIGKALAMLGN